MLDQEPRCTGLFRGMTVPDALRRLAGQFAEDSDTHRLCLAAADDLDDHYAHMTAGSLLDGMSGDEINAAMQALADKGDNLPPDRTVPAGETGSTFGTLQERIDDTADHG